MRRQTPSPTFPILFLFAVLTGGLGIIATRPYGLGVSTDAVEYLFTGLNLFAGRGFASYDLRPYTLWPPLYPILLGAVQAVTGLSLLASAALLHLLTLLGLAAALARLMLRLFPGRWLWPLLGIALVELAPVTLTLAQSVTSDYLFLLLSVLFCLDAGRWLGARGSVPAAISSHSQNGPAPTVALFWRLFAWGMLASLQRYIGAAVILAAVVVMVLGPGPWRRRLGLAGLQGLAVLPLLAWVSRNAALDAGWFGPRGQVELSSWALPAALARLLAAWLIPQTPYAWVTWLSWGGVCLSVLLLAAGTLLAWRRAVPSGAGPVAGTAAAWRRFLQTPLAPLLIFAALYAGMLLLSLARIPVTSIQERFLAPLLPPVVAALLLALAEIEAWLRERLAARASRLASLVALLPLAWLAVMGQRSGPLLADFAEASPANGNRYNTPEWRAMPILRYLQDHPLEPQAVLFSNLPAGVAFHTGRIVLPSPRNYDTVHPAGQYDLSRFEGVFDRPGQAMYLAWIEPNPYEHVFLPIHLRGIVTLKKLAAFDDGSALYEVTAK